MSEDRRRALAIAVLVLGLFGVGFAYLVWASGRVDADIAEREATALEAVETFEQAGDGDEPMVDPTPAGDPDDSIAPQPGEVFVINRVPGSDYGRLALRHTDGTRTLLDRRCMRVHVAGGKGVCLASDGALLPRFTSTLFDATDPDTPEIKRSASPLPSRARVSPDGTLVSTTGFVTGTSYADVSTDAQPIVTIDSFVFRNATIGMRQFAIEGERNADTPDAKYWGVTFRNSDEFYVTGWFGGDPEILRGSIDQLTLEPTGRTGSCPSLSPDGRTLVYKRPDGDGFDLVAVDLESQRDWVLSETRSVDDQVEWLDDDTILYALHPEDDPAAVEPQFDIWSLDIAEGSTPQLFLPAADSPAVVR